MTTDSPTAERSDSNDVVPATEPIAERTAEGRPRKKVTVRPMKLYKSRIEIWSGR